MAFNRAILCSASLLALLAVDPAFAQTGAQSTPPSDGGTTAAAGDTTATPTDQALDASEPQTDEIVVKGVRASIVGALNTRKNSTQIVDSIVAEDVGKLPDNNVIEALQRVTGIQVTNRSGGEAAGISIRGLSDALTTLNGRNIFTAAGQSFSLQDVSANLIKSVDVYKTRAADQIETGLAGQVDVKTRRPFDFDGFALSGLARGIYNQQADSYNPNVALLVSDRWETGIGDIGVLVNGSYIKTNYRDMTTTAGALVPFATMNPAAGTGLDPFQRIFPAGQDPITGQFVVSPGLGAWQVGTDTGLATAPGSSMLVNGVSTPYVLSRDAVFNQDLYGQRERPSANIAIQWAPNSSSVYTAEAFYSGFRGNTFNSMQFSFVDFWEQAQAPTLYDGTNIVKSRVANSVYGFNSADYTQNKTDSFVYALNGKWDVAGGRGKIVADIAYQTSTYNTAFIAMRTDRTANQIKVDFNAGGGIPSFHFNDDSLLTKPATWNVAQLYDNAERDHGSAITATLDGEYTWDEGFLRRIKGGWRIDDRKAAVATRTQDALGLGVPLSTLGAGTTFTNSGFFDGRADVPTSWVLPSGYWVYANADKVRSLYGLKTSGQLSLGQVFTNDEVTMSAYLMADGELSLFGRPLQIEGGVRFVTVDTNSQFFNRLNNFAETDTSTATTKFLPSATLRYEITNKLRLRFNFGETLRRPDYTALNPNYTLTGDLTGLGYGSGTAGTANLRPTQSKNYDVALEWYFDRDSAITVTGFRREIDGLVVPVTQRETILNNGIVAGATNSFAITRPLNASNGVLKGVEVGLTYFPHYLPGPLDGLGFVGSLTVLDSSQNIPQYNTTTGELIGQFQSAFFGVSKFSYNATLAYDKGPIGARVSYVWRKEFLANNEARLFANPIGVWRSPEKSLDVQLTYNLTKRLGVTFDATNLTNSTQQTYYKFGDTGGPEKFNLGTLLLARTFALGVRYGFR